jgi:hypothetical protein
MIEGPVKPDYETEFRDGSEVRDPVYAAFQNLNDDQWRNWLEAFLSGEPREPLVAATNEYWHQILIRLFDGLTPKSAVAFKRALFKVFEQTSVIQTNEYQLYTLLHVIAYAPPGEAKQLLRRRLREGIFRNLRWRGQNLHHLVLQACSKYHVDEGLAKWIQRSARSSKDYDYLLLCQRILAATGDQRAFYFTERLLPLIDSSEVASEATRQLASISKKLGYADFLHWFKSRSFHLESSYRQNWLLFVDSLRERLLSDSALPALAVLDRDAVLLYAELRIAKDLIPLDTVLKIARLHMVLEVEETSVILTNIWKDLFFRTGEPPWNYFEAADKTRVAKEPGLGTISQNSSGYPEVFVPATEEPKTEAVLVNVRNKCASLLPPEIAVGAPA